MTNPYTPKATLRAAKALALALNGGDWDRDYTDEQKQVWINRIRSME
jgi:hypothetical protein